jgi:hypothetical protein
MIDTWYMVLNPYPTGQKPTVRHETFEEAQREALRLSEATTQKMHVLQLVGTAYPPSTPRATFVHRAGRGCK